MVSRICVASRMCSNAVTSGICNNKNSLIGMLHLIAMRAMATRVAVPNPAQAAFDLCSHQPPQMLALLNNCALRLRPAAS